ncbi:MAG: relaxase/mobilization nuclease domain-containing protein, partial [Bacteroidales bacterium]|nr:relaxase/mobilization nuclease domain-containing protein [Bacteroidales bacterium]
QNKIDEENGKVLFTHKIPESEDGTFSINRCMEAFQMQMPLDLRTKKPVIHISLNPHPDDKLSDNQLSEIAQEYMEKLGYGNQPYMVYKHEDIDRHHIHIVSIRVDENGKKLNDKFEHLRSKDITRELEQKYNLHPAEKQQKKDEYQFRKVNYTQGDVKRQISNTVKGLIKSYQFQSFNEFKTLLSLYNIHAEELKGEANGKPYNGIIYSATNDLGEKQGNPFKSSRLGKTTGFEAIQRKIEQSSKSWKEGNNRNIIKQKIADVLQSNISRQEFEKQLKDKQIDILFRENSDGRIYGVTFINHESKTVINGSRLGKEFSANVFNDLFRMSSENDGHTKQVHPPHDPKESFTPVGETFEPSERLSKDSDGGIGSLFSILPDGSDAPSDNDQVYPPKKKRRKRKKIN